MTSGLFDVTDATLRAAAVMKWAAVADDVIPAWVAEMDVRPCPAVTAALHAAVDAGTLGYPAPDARTGLPEATAHLMRDRFGLDVDPALVIVAGDVMGGIELVLTALAEAGPVVVPVPTYPPFLDAVAISGRRTVTVPGLLEHGRHVLNLARIDAALAAGARTVLLANPANPLGRAWTRDELGALRDVVVRHGARVISDEIHAPLVLDGTHVPYASLPGTSGHVTTVVSATKAWNLPGLKCAQVIAGAGADRDALAGLPHLYNHGVSSLGIVASVAAYREGGEWLDDVREHLAGARAHFGRLVEARLPGVRWIPMEATYLAWLDLGGLLDDGTLAPGADPVALALERGRVLVSPGGNYLPGDTRHVRVNIGTSLERLDRIVAGLAGAWR